MPLNIPARRDVVGATQAYVRTALPELDPSTERRSFIGGLVKSLASALHDFYVALKRYADNEPFPQTASRDFLYNGWWRDITGLSPNPAAASTGQVVIQGTHGTILSTGAVLSSGNVSYTTDAAATVTTQSLNASSLTRSGATAIFETATAHGLATGMQVVISGATQTGYNGTFTITVTADNEFTYPLGALTPVTPATGTPILTATWGNVDITADVVGEQGNLDGGATLTVAAAPAGLDATAIVTFGTIGGGGEAESVESYRERILEALGTDFGTFSAAEIKIIAKTVPGVTRVWVKEASLFGAANGVNEGQVVIAFMRDNDADPFPSASEVATVKAAIVDTIMPAHTAEEDVSVMSPTPQTVDITLQIIPDTPSMRRAITQSLTQLFDDGVDFATTVTRNSIICAIEGTYDREGRQKLASFTMITPSTDVTVGATSLPILGDVEFT